MAGRYHLRHAKNSYECLPSVRRSVTVSVAEDEIIFIVEILYGKPGGGCGGPGVDLISHLYLVIAPLLACRYDGWKEQQK